MLPTPPWWTKPEWWSAIGTISAVIVAIFAETIWTWLRRPKLELSICMKRPDCVKTPVRNAQGQQVGEAYYCRVLVSNNGKRAAENVEVNAERLECEDAGELTVIEEFPPMDLNWAHLGRPLQNIAPGIRNHCDLGHVFLPTTEMMDEVEALLNLHFSFDLEVRPNQGG